MNFKTLTAIGAAATVVGLLAAPQAKADSTQWIWDGSSASGDPGNTAYTTGPAGTYSRETSGASNSNTWYDTIGWELFETSAIRIDTDSTSGDVTVTTYTNYYWNGYQNRVPLADWFFDLDRDGTFDYAFTPDGTPDGMGGYDVTGALQGIVGTTEVWDSVTAMGPTGLNLPGAFTHYTAVCSNNGSDCQANARPAEVHVNSGGVATIYTDDITDGGGGTLGGPLGPGEYDYSWSFTLAGINGVLGDWSNVHVFWGTGWCANDTIENVPIPAAAWLFGSAIFGLGAVGWKRRSPAA
jgi:hypothetical protein